MAIIESIDMEADGAHPVHEALAALAAPGLGVIVVDLGCGPGATLAAIAASQPGALLVGIDLTLARLAGAFASAGAGRRLMVHADVSRPLPLRDSAVDTVVCHNVVELLASPLAVLSEVRRVLRPGGRAVVSHTDFAGLVVHGADPGLTMRVLDGYAHVAQRWMRHIDAHAARRLPGLIGRAGLALHHFEAHTVAYAHLDGHARRRVEEITDVVGRHAHRGLVDLTETQVKAWRTQLDAADTAGGFCFTETALITVSSQPEPL